MLSVVAPKVTDLKVKVTLVLQQSVQQLFVRMTSQESPNGILTIISNLIIYYFWIHWLFFNVDQTVLDYSENAKMVYLTKESELN